MPAHPKLTPEVVDILEQAFLKNYSPKAACAVARISDKAFKVWMERGAELQEKIDAEELDEDSLTINERFVLDFYVRIKVADANAENTLVDVIALAAKNDYRAADLLLSKRHGWGVRVETKNQTQINIVEVTKTDLTGLTVEELAQLEELQAKAEGFVLEDSEPKRITKFKGYLDTTFKSEDVNDSLGEDEP